MSNYWKKKLDELEKQSAKSSTNSTKKTVTKTDYWQDKMTELEKETEKRKKAEDIAPVASTTEIAPIKTVTEDDDKQKWYEGWFKKGNDDAGKATVGTAADAGTDLLTGIVGIGEKLWDGLLWLGGTMGESALNESAQGQLTYNLIAGKKSDDVLKTHEKAKDDLIKSVDEEIAKDLYDEEVVAKKIIAGLASGGINPVPSQEELEIRQEVNEETLKYLETDMEADSVFDQKIDSLMQSAGQLAATAVLQEVGVPWWVTTGATTFGAETENALQNGATHYEAGASAAISAGAEILTEKISGGISFGGTTLDDALTKQLGNSIANKFWRTAAKLGLDVAGEGAEEWLTEDLSKFGQWLTYRKEEELVELLFSEEAMDEKIQAFISGAALSGASSGINAVKSTAEGVDYVTGLTKTEEAVVNKEVENRIAEMEEDGTKLTNKQKADIKQQVMDGIDKGYISTDTIEEVLGGDTFKSYKETAESEDALLKEYEELGNKKDATLAEQQRFLELTKQVGEINENSKSSQLKQQLGSEVFDLVKGSRLVESYNENARIGQAFEADLSKYNAKQQKTIQKAIDSGILNNTNRTHEFVDLIANISADKGVLFDFTNNERLKESGFAIDGKTVNGYVTKDGITLNLQSSKSLNSVVGHEITHVLEGTAFYSEMQKALFDYAKSKGDYQGRYDTLAELYKGVKDANVEAELTADLVGDYLFTDADFVNNLSTQHRNVFQKIYDEIKYLCKVATAGSEQARELEKVKKLFDQAYKVGGKGNVETNGVNYALMGKNKDGIEVYETSKSIMDMSWKERKAKYIEVMKEEYRGRTAKFERNGHTYYAQFDQGSVRKPIYGDDRSSTAGVKALIKAGADGDVFDLVENSQYTGSKTNTKTNTNADYFDYFVKTVQIDGKVFDLVADVEKEIGTPDGYVYTLALVDNKKIEASPAHGTPNMGPVKSAGTASIDNVAQNSKNVNPQYSLTDNTGKQLTKGQQEYFKDSKVRDENGNLLVVYHGSKNSGFNVFEYSKDVQTGTDYGEAFYFTSDFQKASGYSYDVTKDTRVAQYQKEKDALMKKFLETGSEEDKNAVLNYKLDGKSLFDLMNDEGYQTEGGEVKEVYLNLKNPLIVDAGGKYYYEVYQEYFDRAKKGGNDGIIVKNVIDNPRGEARPIDTYIAFSQEQIKSTANEQPTGDPDIRFSLSKPVEETKDLVALHNVYPSKLLDALRLGGLPSPSTAVTRRDIVHDNYGPVSMLLKKSAIDPQADRRNKVYGSDAWTPTSSNARTEYEVDISKMLTLEKRLAELGKKTAGGAFSSDSLIRRMGVEDVWPGDASNLAERLANNDEVRAAYLADIGKTIEPEYRTKEYNSFGNASLQKYIDLVGEQHLASVMAELAQGNTKAVHAEEETIKGIMRDWYAEMNAFSLNQRPDLKEARINGYMKNRVSYFTIEDFVRDAWTFYEEGGAVTEEIDRLATSDKVRNAVTNDEVKAWLEPQIAEMLGEPGIYNGQDPFMPDGTRKSFEETHFPYTAENIVKAMQMANARGENTTGANAGSLIATATPSYNSIEEIHADKGRLKVEDKETYDNILAEIDDSLDATLSSIIRTTKHHTDNTFDEKQIIGGIIIEAATGERTVSAVQRAFAKEGYTISAEQANQILQLYEQAAVVPTGYFEAKPERVVGFDEVAVVVIPYNSDAKLKQELLNKGLAIAEYDPNVEGDRQRVVNQFEQYMFSLSNVGDTQKTHGNYNVYGKDVVLPEVAPVQDTVQETTPKPTVANYTAVNAQGRDRNTYPDEFAPATEEEATAQAAENFAHIDEADMPPEQEAPYPIESPAVTADNPFYSRDVDDRKTKAFETDYPDAKPFFKEAAYGLSYEHGYTMPAERWYNDELYYRTNGEQGFGGHKRMAAPDIETLRDYYNLSYDQISEGIDAIINDTAKINNKPAKIIELILHDRLTKGYKNWVDGTEVPPNQEYINWLKEHAFAEASAEDFASITEADMPPEIAPIADDFAPVVKPAETVKPVESAPIAPTPPTTPKATQAIKPKAETQPRMAKATPAEQARASILTEEPKAEKEKGKLWSQVKNNVIDKGTVFETISLKTGNRELQARWNSIRNAEKAAQRAIDKHLNPIREAVEKSGKTQQFYEYMYHNLNVDRMTLEQRYKDTPNKTVFGDSVTADVSRDTVAKLEKANPEFKQWADAVYDYMADLRDYMVHNGIISNETAKLWAEMYPHYVPIRRLGDEGLNINVPLDTGRTGVNAPVKRAKGGNRDILPMFDTMGQRTIQTFKAVSKNRFGVELKNTLGTTIDSDSVGLDEAIDSVEMQDGLLQEGKNGRKPTFTVFENGEKVTFEITDEMYDAMKPTSDLLATTIKPLNAISNFRRNTLTQYNPWFMLKNAAKDVQDVLINSQHPARTYLAIPKALAQMTTNGRYYQEYMDNGGDSSSYFDKDTNTFTKENKALELIKTVTGLNAIAKANDIIERIPRLAEYIASREAGRSVDVAMLDSARVTTNFAAGGDLTKALNRNGFTFLNASVQGFVQQVRNVREAKHAGLKGVVGLAAKYLAAGLPALLLNHLLWDDDEEYAELSDYVKDNYYIVGKNGDGQFVRIPKGRMVAVIQNGFEQMENLITGNDEVDMSRFADLCVTNLAPNNPAENNILSPITDVIQNKTWYGEDMVPTRLQDLPTKEQYDESTDSISRWLGENIPGISPIKANYLLDQYSGVIGDTFLPMLTPEAESGDNSFMGNVIAPLKDMFTTDSVMNNQNVGDFYDTVDELAVNANAREATDEDVLKYKYMSSVNAEMGKLYGQKREIQSSDLPDDVKYAKVREIQRQIDEMAKSGLGTYGGVNIDDGYATVGDRHYRWKEADGDTEAGWQKITDKQLEKQEEVTSGLGISASEYWGNKEEYDYAYEYPEKYAVAKSVGGYKDFRWYSSELYDIKADKDSDGKSISGSRKEKVIDYVNSLDIDYGMRIILFKSEYNADDTYNEDIIDYLNSRDDISREDMIAILKELGFTVTADGTIRW